MKPALLIDVDGVLCPFGSECPEGYEVLGAAGSWVWVSHANRERLARLQETFELIWATAWEDRANTHLAEFHGLPQLPVIEFSGPVPGVEQKMGDFRFTLSRFSRTHWKLPWIEHWAGERPFAWIDDEIDAATRRWAEERAEAGVPTLALRIPFATGLTDGHVEELEAWANGITQDDGDGA